MCGMAKKSKKQSKVMEPRGKKIHANLRPTEEQRQAISESFDWQERSSRTVWIVGEPL